MSEPIYVTKSSIPDEKKFFSFVKDILSTGILTNNGPFCRELENKLKKILNVPNLTLCSNGTSAIEIALHAAGAAGKKIITTPFTYVATLTAPLWVGCEVIFADIDPQTLCISPHAIANKMDKDIAAVIAVNVYGHPCDNEGIYQSAQGAQIIYDGAQAMGTTLNGRSLLDFGNFATCSLHATKALHAFEGGFVVSHNADARARLCLLRAFGHNNDEYECIGINAKISEIHAAMALALLDDFKYRQEKREKIDKIYRQELTSQKIRFPLTPKGFVSNYTYFPVIFASEQLLCQVLKKLNENNIWPRRYFYPALTILPYVKRQVCPVTEAIAPRVLCLPIYSELHPDAALRITQLINQVVNNY